MEMRAALSGAPNPRPWTGCQPDADVLFFNEWRAASKAASAAERIVSEAFMLYFNGKGRPPSPGQVAEARKRRQVADDLFHAAMKHWDGVDKKANPFQE